MKRAALKKNNIFRKKFGWFTFVELLVSISIIAVLAIAGYTSMNHYKLSSYNSRRIADIDTLGKSIDTYLQSNKRLPDPTANIVYYDDKWVYSHSASGAYGLSSYVSREFLPREYMNYLPTDPDTAQFYAFGKRIDDSGYDLSSVLSQDGTYVSYLRGSYDGKRLTSLVRSYSSSDFVSDGSTEALPYNPYERKITAMIDAWSGSVTVNNSSTILTGTLNTGDTIFVESGSTASLHISDGSELSLGSTTGQTKLNLADLSYKSDDNLSSRVSLWLQSGEVWAEAPHLRSETGSVSEFTIQTDSAVAAVRGTVFGMTESPSGSTNITLVSGKIEVAKKTAPALVDPSVSTGLSTFDTRLFGASTGSFYTESGHTIMQTTDNTPITLSGVTLPSATGTNLNHDSTTSTGTMDINTIKPKIRPLGFSSAYHPRITSLSGSTNSLIVAFESVAATYYRAHIESASGTFDFSGSIATTDTSVTLSGSTTRSLIIGSNAKLAFSLCVEFGTKTICSAPTVLGIPAGTFSLDNISDTIDNIGKVALTKTGVLDVLNSNPTLVGQISTGTLQLVNASGVVLDSGLVRGFQCKSSNDEPPILSLGYPNDVIPSSSCDGITSSPQWQQKISAYGSCVGTYLFVKKPYTCATKGYINPSTDNTILVNTGKVLSYNISSLGIASKFAIEVGVRGGALKRSGNYLLYHWGSIYLHKYTSSSSSLFNVLEMWFKASDGTYHNVKKINQTDLSKLQDNVFYTVRTEYDWATWNLKIIWNETPISWTDCSSNGCVTPDSGLSIIPANALYVGSTNDFMYQWNDSISSFKIYKSN